VSLAFDLAAAINKIAELEAAIAGPTPGIVTAYGYNANPTIITSPALLPAIVHVPMGPVIPDPPGEYSHGLWQVQYHLYSRALLIQSVPDKSPGDDAAANLFWQPLAEAFLNDANRRDLCTAAGAEVYACSFGVSSYAVRPWPPVVDSPHFYWSLQYTHIFTMFGGGG
jgi:hypothetical protein